MTSFTLTQKSVAVDHSKAHPQPSETANAGPSYSCDQPGCGQSVVACINRKQAACTSFVAGAVPALCEWCRFTSLIPDLDQPSNLSRWITLEAAKRRLLSELERLGLPPFLDDIVAQFPLTFQFAVPTSINGVLQPVVTGHAQGVITINAEEADSDRREATRVALGEPQRTLIGHMRHEIGHYIDWAYAWRIARERYVELFGDPLSVNYEQAKERHYSVGAPSDWPTRFVSAYASMHPWEDFAETVNAYLDLMAIAETSRDQKLSDIDTSHTADMARIIQQTLPVAVAISEFNTDLGLQALLPEQLSQTAVNKLCFVHSLRHPDRQANLKQQRPFAAGNEIADAVPKPPKSLLPKPSSPARVP